MLYEVIFIDIDFNEYPYAVEGKTPSEAESEARKRFEFDYPEISPDELYDIEVYLCDRKWYKW